MSDIEELIEEAEGILSQLGDFCKLKHLWSDDVDIKNLAGLRRSIGRMLFKLRATKVREVKFPENHMFHKRDIGNLVRVRPCGDEYGGRTYLGIMLGEAALGTSMHLSDDDNAVQLKHTHYNPAMYVPELNDIIYGCGSWWSEIESEEDLRDITDERINNTWYVKLLKDLHHEKCISREKGEGER